MTNNADTPAPAAPAENETRWESRRFAAWSLRMAIVLAPMVAAVIVMAVVSRIVPRPHAGSALLLTVGWWAEILACSLAALWTVDRAARRLTPLAALLDLAVLFPGRAPTRFAVARKAGDLRSLKTLSEKGSPRERGDVATAAEQILALVGSLRAHDRHTRGHSERVRVYTDMIAAELHLPAAGVDRLRWAALLHDIGKLWIPASVLNKPGKLSKSEWEAIRLHPAHGAELAADLLPWLGPWGLAIAEHHEHYDGSGYPAGLSGTHISLAGRIVAVADSFETMTAARPYKKARTRAAGLEELVRFSGQQFDPDVVRALLAVSAPKLAWAMGPASWLTGLPFIGSAPSLTGAGLAAQTATGVAGVAAASVAGVAVAAVPTNPAPPSPSFSASASTTLSVGAPASPPRLVSGSTDTGVAPAGRTQTPTSAPFVASPTPTATPPAAATPTAAAPALATPSPTSPASPTKTASASPAAKPVPTPTPKKTATPPPSAKAPVVPPPAPPAPPKPTPTPTPPAPPAPPTPTPPVAPPAPPAPPAVGAVQVNYRDVNPLPLANQLMPEIEVVNTGKTPIDLATVTVRYWFTADGNSALKYTCYYLPAGCGTVTGTFVKTGGHDADTYLQLQYSGILAPGATTGMMQLAINHANFGVMQQTNDYSYGSSMASQPWTHITAYANGKLIWGQEP